MTYQYFNNCVNWDDSDVHVDGGLVSLIDSSQNITRKTFLRKVNIDELRGIEDSLGYVAHHKQGLTMAGDYHVAYFRSYHHGKRVYGFVHSAIEYVFMILQTDITEVSDCEECGEVYTVPPAVWDVELQGYRCAGCGLILPIFPIK